MFEFFGGARASPYRPKTHSGAAHRRSRTLPYLPGAKTATISIGLESLQRARLPVMGGEMHRNPTLDPRATCP